jgi:hypothetical protein
VSQITILKTEITTDPLARGYSGMTNQQVADSLNTVNRPIQRTTLTGAEIYEQTDITEFQGKTAAQQIYVRDIWGLGGNIAVGAGSKARTVMITVFGAGSVTIANLLAILTTNISRATEIGATFVFAHDVANARL